MVMRDAERLKVLADNIKGQIEYLVKKEAFILAKSMRGELPISLDPKPPLVREIEGLIEQVHKNIMGEVEKL